MSQVSGRQIFEPLLAPIIYAQGTTDADGIFQNEVLFSVCLYFQFFCLIVRVTKSIEIGICCLFGYTAIRSKGKIPKNSLGVKWGIKSVTSGLIAFCSIAVSDDII
jgi:hypothetical protein